MYRAVIISCLIAVACANTISTISPVYNGNRFIRQAKPVESANPAKVLTDSGSQQKPESKTAPITAPTTAPTTAVAEKSNQTSSESGWKSYVNTLVSYGAITGNYFLQIMGAVFLSTSVVGLICSYTPTYCYVESNEARRFARSVSLGQNYPEYNINDFTSILERAIDIFATTKQTRRVEK